MKKTKNIAVFCVGNQLMYDDGLGSVVYKQLEMYEFEPKVALYDLGCLTLDQIEAVRNFDTIITVDAVDGSGQAPGTLLRYKPDDLAKREFGMQSLHDLRLSDLFDAAALLGYSCEGLCLGMQVANPSPAQATIGLSPVVYENVPLLVDCVLAELVERGVQVRHTGTGVLVRPGYHHEMKDTGLQ